MDNFNDYIHYHVEMERARFSDETLKSYRSEVTKLANWNPSIKVSQINRALIMEYDAHMR
jgi:site-specific recombinase XerD